MKGSWHRKLADEIIRMRADGLDFGNVEVQVPRDSWEKFFENVFRINLSEFCGAAPETLLIIGRRRDTSGCFVTFAWRDLGWNLLPLLDGARIINDKKISIYPPTDFGQLDPREEG